MPKPELCVFLDTNVIFFGLYSSKGAPGAILRVFIEGRIRVVVSRHVLEETIRTLKNKLPEALPALNRFLVNTPPEVGVDPTPEAVNQWANELHPADAAILPAAIAAKSDIFVTGDNHFLKNQTIREKADLNIVTPDEFLRLLETSNQGD